MPEGDTIAYAANRIRPVLAGRVPDEILTPQPRHALDRWPDRARPNARHSLERGMGQDAGLGKNHREAAAIRSRQRLPLSSGDPGTVSHW